MYSDRHHLVGQRGLEPRSAVLHTAALTISATDPMTCYSVVNELAWRRSLRPARFRRMATMRRHRPRNRWFFRGTGGSRTPKAPGADGLQPADLTYGRAVPMVPLDPADWIHLSCARSAPDRRSCNLKTMSSTHAGAKRLRCAVSWPRNYSRGPYKTKKPPGIHQAACKSSNDEFLSRLGTSSQSHYRGPRPYRHCYPPATVNKARRFAMMKYRRNRRGDIP